MSITERELLGLARDVERAKRYLGPGAHPYCPARALALMVSVEERLWDAVLLADKDSPGTVPGQTVEGESQGASTPAAVERGDDDEGQENSTDAPGNRGTAITDAHLERLLQEAKYTDDPAACEAVRKRLFGGGT